MKLNILFASVLMSTALNVFADDAKALTVYEEVTINAPAAKVWATVSNFNDLGAWHPAVKKTEIVSGSNNKVGAERLLTLQDDGTIKEKLLAYNAKNKSFKYAIVEGVLPVSSYTSTLNVRAQGKDKTLVAWTGHFKRKDTAAMPAAGQDDEAAVKTMTSVYRGGLDNLKKISE
jgi:mxaD protein